MVAIIKNLSEITAGSPMVGSPINLVQRPMSPGLIKDLWIKPLRPKTSEMVKGHERKVELPGIEPRAIGFGHNGLIQRSLIRPGLIGLWTKLIGVPTIGLPAT